MKIIKYSLFILTFWLLSCDSLLDVNVDPARISPEQVTVQTLLPSAIRFTAQSYYGAGERGTQYPQYLGGQAISQFAPYGFDQIWRPLYTDAFPSLQELIELGEAQGAFNYSGIGKTLLGLIMLTATDIYGDLPYTEANRGISNLNPCYDPMQELYEVHILELLNGAIEDLQRPAPTLPSIANVRNDYIYNGNVGRWLKAAYAVRARYYLHLSNRQPNLLANAIADANRAFESVEDDLQLVYEENVPNPWFSFLGNAINKVQRPTSYITNMMNGTAQYPGLSDPRLPFFMSNGGQASFIGVTPGRLVDDEPAVNVDLTQTNWFSRNNAPLPMITYAETQFILAEALFPTNRGESYQAYLRGIRASMQKVGVAEADIDAYIDDPLISKGQANLQLSDIMLQKYIALYLNIETWTDMRRYQYDDNVYLGLAKPVENQIPGEPWVQRSNIADDEPGVNSCLPELGGQDRVLWLFE